MTQLLVLQHRHTLGVTHCQSFPAPQANFGHGAPGAELMCKPTQPPGTGPNQERLPKSNMEVLSRCVSLGGGHNAMAAKEFGDASSLMSLGNRANLLLHAYILIGEVSITTQATATTTTTLCAPMTAFVLYCWMAKVSDALQQKNLSAWLDMEGRAKYIDCCP